VRVGEAASVRLGGELVQGLPLSLRAGETVLVEVADGGNAPYGR
jgi:hypothetical protein